MKKLAIAGAVLAALSLSACAGSAQDYYEIDGIPFEQDGKECVSITFHQYDREGLFDGTAAPTKSQVYCVDTVKLDQKTE